MAPNFYLPHLNFLLAPGKRAMLNVEPWRVSPTVVCSELRQFGRVREISGVHAFISEMDSSGIWPRQENGNNLNFVAN